MIGAPDAVEGAVLLPQELSALWPNAKPFPLFASPTWDLAPLLPLSTRRTAACVHFERVADLEVRAALRSFLQVRLACAAPPHRQSLRPLLLKATFHLALECFLLIKAEFGCLDFGLIEQRHLDKFLRKYIREGRSAVAISNRVVIWQDLYLFRAQIPGGGLGFFPWSGRAANNVAGSKGRRGENLTRRIPEHQIQRLMFWSLKYVEEFADDILLAREELASITEMCSELFDADMKLSPHQRDEVRWERVQAFIGALKASGRGVPVWQEYRGRCRRALGRVNFSLISLMVGDPKNKWLKHGRYAVAMRALLDEVGPQVGGLSTPRKTDGDLGREWRPAFDLTALIHESRLLQTACYIVCAYLTGMRDSEVQSMRSGCLSLVRSEDGVIERYWITAERAKGPANSRPEAQWVAIEPVAKAVKVLERLRGRESIGNLWGVIDGVKIEGGYDTISYGINRYIEIFVNHIEDKFEPGFSEGAGFRWRFTSRQFRRTMAWHIAHRPFGVVAGKIQYKHASVAAFEGYAGTSASGFMAEVEAERVIAQLDSILEYYADYSHGRRMGGPGANRVQSILAGVTSSSDDLPGLVVDDNRLRKLLKSPARNLHVGLLSDCFFDADRALCLVDKVTAGKRPVIALCAPTRCGNSCIRESHLAAWQQASVHARRALEVRGLSKAQRLAIKEDIARIDAVLSAITPEQHAQS